MNAIFFDSLTLGERRLVEWQYGFAGSFVTGLFRLLSIADMHNLERLAKGFPSEVQAYRNYAYVNGWWQGIQRDLFAPEDETVEFPTTVERTKEL